MLIHAYVRTYTSMITTYANGGMLHAPLRNPDSPFQFFMFTTLFCSNHFIQQPSRRNGLTVATVHGVTAIAEERYYLFNPNYYYTVLSVTVSVSVSFFLFFRFCFCLFYDVHLSFSFRLLCSPVHSLTQRNAQKLVLVCK